MAAEDTKATASPVEETLLSRVLARGPGGLTDAELLALILNADDDRTVLAATAGLLKDHRKLSWLLRGGIPALRGRLSQKEAAQLAAVYEVAVRLAKEKVPVRISLDRPSAVVRYLHLRYGRLAQEVMGVLFLDNRDRLLADRELFRGTLSRTFVDPKPILRDALLEGAAGLIIFHTHPSTDPRPSIEDLQFTTWMRRAGEVLGLPVKDHLIVGGPDRWISVMRTPLG
jgi:DNA repair protein RadC